jgi:hypothetical protein
LIESDYAKNGKDLRNLKVKGAVTSTLVKQLNILINHNDTFEKKNKIKNFKDVQNLKSHELEIDKQTLSARTTQDFRRNSIIY